jgi:hypothetical protein
MGDWLADSFGEGWAANWVIDLDTGKGVNWELKVSLYR